MYIGPAIKSRFASKEDARHYFYKSLRHKWFRLNRLIIAGDFNNVEDEYRDRIRTTPVHNSEDITTFLEFRASHKLLDSYIEQYELDEDEPIMMTNTTHVHHGNLTHSRIDRAYYSQSLHGKIRFDDPDTIPPAAVSTQGHTPIAITILDPSVSTVHQYKKIWRMNIDSINDPILKTKVNSIIDYCYTQALITNQYTKWWDDMKYRIKVMIRTFEDAKASQLKSQVRADELIVKPSNGHTKEMVEQAKNRIKARNQKHRHSNYLINKSMDQLEGSKLTRFQFRAKQFTTYGTSAGKM